MMLEIHDLRAAYGRIPILNGVSFTVADGEFVGILGHNGMGKTTLLQALMGYLPATAGHVRFEQNDITSLEPYRRARLGFGYVPQGREIFPALTVYDNLRMGCSKQAASEKADHRNGAGEFPAAEAAARPDRRRACRAASSNCSRSRAACAASLASCCSTSRPRASSRRSSTRSWRRLLRLRDKSGLTIILVEQNLDFIAALSQRILIIQKGTITGQVQPDDLHNAESCR